MENGGVQLGRDLDYRYGQMERDMRGSGKIIKHVAKVNFGTLMVMCSMVNGKRTRLMAMEYIYMSTVLVMKGIGKTIYKMVMELRHGLMAQDMKDNIKRVKNITKVHMFGVTDQNTLDNGQIIKSVVTEYTLGLMGENMKVNG